MVSLKDIAKMLNTTVDELLSMSDEELAELESEGDEEDE